MPRVNGKAGMIRTIWRRWRLNTHLDVGLRTEMQIRISWTNYISSFSSFIHKYRPTSLLRRTFTHSLEIRRNMEHFVAFWTFKGQFIARKFVLQHGQCSWTAPTTRGAQKVARAIGKIVFIALLAASALRSTKSASGVCDYRRSSENGSATWGNECQKRIQ